MFYNELIRFLFGLEFLFEFNSQPQRYLCSEGSLMSIPFPFVSNLKALNFVHQDRSCRQKPSNVVLAVLSKEYADLNSEEAKHPLQKHMAQLSTCPSRSNVTYYSSMKFCPEKLDSCERVDKEVVSVRLEPPVYLQHSSFSRQVLYIPIKHWV